jgi:hypothetical protein
MAEERNEAGALYCYAGTGSGTSCAGCEYSAVSDRRQFRSAQGGRNPCILRHDAFYAEDGTLKPFLKWPPDARQSLLKDEYLRLQPTKTHPALCQHLARRFHYTIAMVYRIVHEFK